MAQKTQQFLSTMLNHADNAHLIFSSSALELLANYGQAY